MRCEICGYEGLDDYGDFYICERCGSKTMSPNVCEPNYDRNCEDEEERYI